MAFDKAVDSAQLNADLTAVANAIRTKGGTDAQLAFPDGFANAVAAIEGTPELQIMVMTSVGAAVTATKGELIVSGTADSTGVCMLTVPETGVWSVKAQTTNGANNTIDCTVGFSYPVKVKLTLTITLATFDDDSPLTKYSSFVLLGPREEQYYDAAPFTVTGGESFYICVGAGNYRGFSKTKATLADASVGVLTEAKSKNTESERYYKFTPHKSAVITYRQQLYYFEGSAYVTYYTVVITEAEEEA